jgi:hypothetical protein
MYYTETGLGMLYNEEYYISEPWQLSTIPILIQLWAKVYTFGEILHIV